MNRNILSIGMVILIVGLFFTLAFWPLFGVSGSELADDYEGNQYESYDEGDTELLHGTVTEVIIEPDQYSGLIGDLLEELTQGVAVEIDNDLVVILIEQNSTDLEVGDEVFGSVTLNEGLFDEYWAHEGDLNSKKIVDYSSYGLLGLGIVISTAGVIKD